MTIRVLHDPRSGAVVDLAIGDTLEIPIRVRGGVAWGVSQTPWVIRLGVGPRQRPDGRGGRLIPGVPDARSLRFLAVGPGRGTLTFSLPPRREHATPRRVEVTVAVRSTG